MLGGLILVNAHIIFLLCIESLLFQRENGYVLIVGTKGALNEEEQSNHISYMHYNYSLLTVYFMLTLIFLIKLLATCKLQ